MKNPLLILFMLITTLSVKAQSVPAPKQALTAPSTQSKTFENYLQNYVHDSLSVGFIKNTFAKNPLRLGFQVYFVKIVTDQQGKPKQILQSYALTLYALREMKSKFEIFLKVCRDKQFETYLKPNQDYIFAIHIYSPTEAKPKNRTEEQILYPSFHDDMYFFEDGSRFMGPIEFTLIYNLETQHSFIDLSNHRNTYD